MDKKRTQRDLKIIRKFIGVACRKTHGRPAGEVTAANDPEALVFAMFIADVKQYLQAQADTKEGLACRYKVQYRRYQIALTQSVCCIGKCTDSRDDKLA